MKVLNAKDIYNKYSKPSDFIEEDERYWGVIEQIVNDIKKNCEEKPILLLSGPSGSGKTTTAQRMESMLDSRGVQTHTISLDCYFTTLSPEEVKKADLESPERLDKALLEEHIYSLLNHKEIELPEFDFANTRQIKSGVKLCRKPNELIIFEGIHALNPDAVSVSQGTAKMYISVRTRVGYGDGKILHPKYIRLLRRISRDMRFRGRNPETTISFFKSVERGVDKYVSPYKIYADYSIDTFIGYEPIIYKDELLSSLIEARDRVAQEDIKTLELLIDFLESIDGREEDLVPRDSLIREFLGAKK